MIDADSAVLLIASLAALLLLYRWHRDTTVLFDLKEILTDAKTGRVSLMKLGQFMALMLSSWALVHEVRANHLTEWLFIGYMTVWSGSNLLSRFTDKPKETKE